MLWIARYKIYRSLKSLKNMQKFRQHNQPSDDVVQKEINLYIRLAEIYLTLQGKKHPFAREQACACYRAASSLGSTQAQYLTGKMLLEEARFREGLQVDGILANENNVREMKRVYEEAHAYLSTAQKRNHIQAKRLLGLCYIHGWGITMDKNRGFDLIIDSIEQENSWDRVQKIFMQMGINKPSFFSELFQHRNKK